MANRKVETVVTEMAITTGIMPARALDIVRGKMMAITLAVGMGTTKDITKATMICGKRPIVLSMVADILAYSIKPLRWFCEPKSAPVIKASALIVLVHICRV